MWQSRAKWHIKTIEDEQDRPWRNHMAYPGLPILVSEGSAQQLLAMLRTKEIMNGQLETVGPLLSYTLQLSDRPLVFLPDR